MTRSANKRAPKESPKKPPKTPPRKKFTGLAKAGESKKQKEIQIVVFRTQVENVEIAYLRNDVGGEGFADALFKTVSTWYPAHDEDIDTFGI